MFLSRPLPSRDVFSLTILISQIFPILFLSAKEGVNPPAQSSQIVPLTVLPALPNRAPLKTILAVSVISILTLTQSPLSQAFNQLTALQVEGKGGVFLKKMCQ